MSARQTTVRQLEVLRVELYAARRKNVQLEAASRRLADETLRWQENLGRAELAYVELSNQYQDVKVRLDEERSRRVQLQQERRTLLNGGKSPGVTRAVRRAHVRTDSEASR